MYSNGAYFGLAVFSSVYMLVFTVVFYVKRNDQVVKASLPLITVFINLMLILFTMFCARLAFISQDICIIYLWVPFILIIVLVNGYLAKAWRFYVIYITGIQNIRALSAEHSDSDSDFSEKPNPRNLVLKKEDKKKRWWRRWNLDDWVIANNRIGSKSFVLKSFAILITAQLIFPVIVNLADKQYYDALGRCHDKKVLELVFLIGILLSYICAFVFLLIKLRKANDAFGIKFQLVGIAASWISFAVLAGLLSFFKNKDANYGLKILTVTWFTVPFFWGTMWPLGKSLWIQRQTRIADRNSGSSDLHPSALIDLHWLISYQDKDQDIGFKSLCDFMNEEFSLVDSLDNVVLHNKLFLLREILKYRGSQMEEEEQEKKKGTTETLHTLQEDNDRKFSARAFLLWQRYLQLEPVDWCHNRSGTAMFPVIIAPDIAHDLTEAMKDLNSPSTINDAKAGEVFRRIQPELEASLDIAFQRYCRSSHFVQLKNYLTVAQSFSVGVEMI